MQRREKGQRRLWKKTTFFLRKTALPREKEKRESDKAKYSAQPTLCLSLPFYFSVWGLKFSPFLSPSPPFPPSFKVGVGWRSSVMLNKSPPRLLPSAAFVAFRRERKKRRADLEPSTRRRSLGGDFSPFHSPSFPPFLCEGSRYISAGSLPWRRTALPRCVHKTAHSLPRLSSLFG